MEANPGPVIQFFSGFKQSVIPLFQRAYEWNEVNWQTLWEDTLERYEATDWWTAHLADDAAHHAEIVHGIGNLTLTGYNAELSNSSFPEKKKLFAESHFTMNAYFAQVECWGRQEILDRADTLFLRAVGLWPRPDTPT